MNNFLKKYFFSIVFFSTIVIAIFLRFFLLQSVPPSASLDEATIGWNAYSILLTGHDEYGYKLPLLLRAYDDYRPALYVYFVIPFIKLFGLRVLSVRLPSAILSVITVVATYFFATTFLKGYSSKKWVGILAMLLLAISPFHIYISRLGHEVNPGLTFALLGALFFLFAVISKKSWAFILSGISWATAFYTYQSEKVFIPLLFISLVVLFWKKIWIYRKIFAFSLILMTLLSLPIVITSFAPQSLIRLKATSVFTNNPLYDTTAKQLLVDKRSNNIIGEIIHNRRIVTAEIFISNYFSHYNPKWWITNSGDEAFKIPGLGLSYTWELPLFILGIFLFLKSQVPIQIKLLPIVWIAISFIAPGITTQAPHAMRSYNILPIPQFLEGFGVVEVFIFLKKFSRKYILSIFWISIVCLFVLFSIGQIINNYFFVFPKVDSYEFQYALSKAIAYTVQEKHNYIYIVFSNKDNAYQSYMFYLFYTQSDPKKYPGTISGGYAKTHSFDNMSFVPISGSLKDKTLYIGNSNEKPSYSKALASFNNLDGRLSLVAFTK